MKPMLAKSYNGQNPKGWLMSEKLDGVRAIWTGAKLTSRNNNDFHAPAWFTDQLPSGVVLDGELFLGRGMFQKTVSVVRKKEPIDAEWTRIRYCVFDAPACPGGFERRLSYCAGRLQGCAFATAVPHEVCLNAAHLQTFAAALLALGAEGVMLRRPGSPYEEKRSDNLLKHKPHASAEAEVIGFQEGEGRHGGRLGALVCRWQGVIVKLGTGMSDDLREKPPKRGDIVTFSFMGCTDGGVPRFPVFLAVRDYE